MEGQDSTVDQWFAYFKQALSHLYEEREGFLITEWVFEETLGLNRAKLTMEKDTVIGEEKQDQLESHLTRLKKGEPVQYVLGGVDFYGCRLALTPDVLIPRPETEELADFIIKRHKGFEGKVLDIGTGSGCLAIAIAKHLPHSSVYAWEYSQEALLLARENANKNHVTVTLSRHNVLYEAPVSGFWDLIACNPPYVENAEKANMGRHVLGYEPPEALFVPEDDPLIFFRRVVHLASQSLNKDGWLYFEINALHGEAIRTIIEDADFQAVTIQKDLRGKDRFAWGKKA